MFHNTENGIDFYGRRIEKVEEFMPGIGLGMAAVVYITVSILCLIGIKSGFTRRRYLR